MNKLRLAIAGLCALPSFAWAQSQIYFDAKRGLNDMANEVAGSSAYGVVGYSLLVILGFLVAIAVVAFLFMILRRH